MAARRSLDSDHGDPLTLLNAFREWLKVKAGIRFHVHLIQGREKENLCRNWSDNGALDHLS